MKKIILAALIFMVSAANITGSPLKLEAIGSSNASNLSLCYLSIGVIADSYVKQVYDNKKSMTFVNSITAQAKVQKDYLQKLLDAKDIPDNDLAVVEKMIDCYGLLIDEGNYFVDYMKTGNKNSLSSYDGKRKQAWALIGEIMGFPQK